MSSNDPFVTLLNLARLARSKARGLPKQEQAGEIWSGVGFELGGRSYVSPLGEVGETIKLPRYTPLPRSRAWVVGLANIRGRLVPILDLGRFLLRSSSLDSPRARIMVLEEEELTVGMLVDNVLGMQRLPAEGYARTVQDVPETIFPFVRGSYPRAIARADRSQPAPLPRPFDRSSNRPG